MEERTTIARPYAEAAYAQAGIEWQIADWADAIELLSAIVDEPSVAVRLNDPRVSREQMADLVISVGGELFSGTRENFIKVLLENGRLGYAPEVNILFRELRAVDENQMDVEVTSAYSLDEVSKDAIAAAVKDKMGKEVQMNVEVDQSLIGGVIVRAGDQVIDLSLRGRMDQLSNTLRG